MEDKMRDATLLGARLLLGSYMGFHASQKLFGKFHGPGLGVVGGGALAGTLIAKMVTAQPGEPPAVPDLTADPAPELAND
jgi:hypothetical protein